MGQHETVVIKGADLRVGDDVEFLGKLYRVLKLTPYYPPQAGLPSEDGWRIMVARGGAGMPIPPDADIRISPRP